ncbi:MAG: hypothetical protein QOE65_2020 [Solirubrobacteraceae bacterium]|jgi:hypothetical protein|nr:hypothetical protein [Solirubrobacteraceae bacterium]
MPGDDRKDEHFSGITYLFVRTHPQDDGTEPLAAGLPWWVSPDIVVVRPDGSRGGVGLEGEPNRIEVLVTNRGGIVATDAYVDVFVANPSLGINPSQAHLVGGGYVTVQGYGTAALSVPWTPTAADSAQGGHRCLVARVSLIVPSDTYRDPNAFDARGDRHVAQRNIHVAAPATRGARKRRAFGFHVSNPKKSRARYQVRARELKPTARNARAVRGALGGEFGELAAEPLRDVRVALEAQRAEDVADDVRGTDRHVADPGADRARLGELSEAPEVSRGAAATAAIGPDELLVGTVAYTVEGAGPGLHVIEVTQVDARTRRVAGGLWVVVPVGPSR